MVRKNQCAIYLLGRLTPMNNKFSKNIVSELLLIALLVLGSCSRPCQLQTSEAVLQNFYSCSTVDWALIDTLYYRPYNCDWPDEIGAQIHPCDWPDEIGAQIHPDFPPEYSARYWHRLQNAKTYLHQQTLPLRSGASEEFVNQLNRTESALDSVFVRIVSQEYYMRIFVDCYEEIMPAEIDKCFEKHQK